MHGMPLLPDKKQKLGPALKKLGPWLKPYRAKLIAAVVLAVLATVTTVVGPKVMGQATTAIFQGLVSKLQGGPGIDFAAVGRVLLIMLGIYALSSLLQWVQRRLVTDVSLSLTYQLSDAVSRKTHRMPLRYFESRQVGDILSLVSNDIDLIGQHMAESAVQFISGVATVLGILVMMLSINVPLALTVVLIVPLSGGIMAFIMRRSQRYFKQNQEAIAQMNGLVEESYTGQIIIKAFRHEQESEKAFTAINEKQYAASWKSQFLSGIMMPVMQFVSNLGYALVVLLGAMQAAQGRISVGDIQAFISYVQSFTQPIAQFAQVAAQLQSVAAASERVFAFLAEEEESDESVIACTLHVQGDVQFDHVRFGYDKDKPVIKDFSCHVLPGQKVALVGETGAGKTTMVKLLQRFYDVDGGAILLDGQDVRTIQRQDLRKSLGMVLQDAWLFSGTIMENIRYGRPDATDEQVIAAARAAHADHFIRTLPGGYQMALSESADNISEGQRQLLTIARAFLKDSPILILDEATSSVDTLTEQRIQRAMEKLMRGRTSFVIAHRLSTIREADLILLMHDGDILEQGTHEELLRLNGHYAALYNSQFVTSAQSEQ